MLKLAAIVYLLVGPAVAGAAVLVALAAPELGLGGLQNIAITGLVGLAVGVPLSWIVAGMLYKNGGS